METAKSSSSKLHSPKCNESTSNDVNVILIFQKNNIFVSKTIFFKFGKINFNFTNSFTKSMISDILEKHDNDVCAEFKIIYLN